MLCGAPPKSVLRPSSTRKSIRLPSKNFETPDARGRKPHWDVSDGDISVDLGSTSGNVLDGAIIIEEDDDEVEYVPPAIPGVFNTLVELCWEFDLFFCRAGILSGI